MKFKRLTSAFLAVVMVGANIINGLLPAMAADDPTVRNPRSVELTDGVVLSKTAESVPGYANMWRVTLKIEAPVVTITSDTVLVIDRSGSMSGNRMTLAKSAAKSLAEELLPEGNTVNRIAVISFGTTINEEVGFSDDYDTVADAIDDIQVGGGTFTQGGLHAAAELIASSTATHKNVILLSDGLPSYSYAINDVGDHLVQGGPNFHSNQFETTIIDSASDFDYTRRVGDGGTSMPENYEVWYQYWHQGDQYRYYNHGNSAISEANFFKSSNNGDLWTIAFNAGTTGNNVLGQMASTGKNKTASESDLEAIFDEIAGEISSLIGNSSVHDVMGEGVIVENPQHSTSLDWTPVYTYDAATGKYVATYTYEVEAGEHILDEDSTDGFHPLNKEATITYNGKTEKFPVPYVKPFFVNVAKAVEGQECDEGECVFDFEIVHPNGNKTSYTVEAGKTHRIIEAFPVGDYTLTETGTNSSNPVGLEYYLTSYSGNVFTINEQHADHIDVTINNKYETKNITAEKEWDDDNNRDGFRSNYDDLYLAVKDGNNYVAFEKVNTDGSSNSQSFTFEDLPKNRNGVEINYTLVEAIGCAEVNNTISCTSDFSKDDDYISTVSGTKVTNSHTPKTTTLTIKKKWDVSAGNLPSVTPGFVTVEVSNDKNDDVETVTLRGNDYEEWQGDFEGYKYEDGQEITYTVTEKQIGNNAFEVNKSTLYIYNDSVLEGEWVANYNGTEVTNVWTPAETVYSGNGEFYIEKLDQDGQPLQGVTFTVGNDTYTTEADGKVAVEFSGDDVEPDDRYTLTVEETSAPDYYALIDGTATIEVTTKLDLVVDEEGLTNTYTKNFEYAAGTMADGYVWRADDNTLVATDQALAKELEIEKSFEGITAEAFSEKSEIEFTITGPEGFDEMTVGIGDDECEISDSKLVCVISGDDVVLPIGEYTVVEGKADIENFTYESDPESGEVSQTAKFGETVKFELQNTYTPVNSASYKVKKVWEDDNNRDGIRPDELAVTLYADGEEYDSSVKLDEDGEWTHEWTNLPLVNENAEEVEYTVKEAEVDGYDSDDGVVEDDVFVFTNTHEPELYEGTGDLQAEKAWSGEGNELVRPATITLVLYGEITDDEGDVKTWVVGNPVEVSDANEWKWTFEGLYKYENGKEITYSVQESAINGVSFDENESTIIIYEDDGQALKGKWTRSVSNFEITNAWTSAINIYNGEDEFTIKKINEGGEVMEGVTFMVGTEEYTTDEDGLIKIAVPEATEVAEDDLEYVIEEIDTLDGYDLVEGSATVAVKSVSEFVEADIEKLENTYSKTYSFSADGDDGYDWDADDKIMMVVNERSKAKSLMIEKTFSGVSESDLQGITFTITGPDDFGVNGGITLVFGEDCKVSETVAICNVSVEIPTGEYTVKENNAEIEHYILTVSGDNGATKEVEKDDEVIFEITNNYEEIQEPEDPCVNGGGCGNDALIPTAPDTGSFTKSIDNSNGETSSMIGAIAMTMLVMSSAIMFSVTELAKRKK